MSNKQADPMQAAAMLRALAEKIDGGEVQSVDVHHDWQASTAEPVSPRQAVLRITVTMPPDPSALGYRIIGSELPNYPWAKRNDGEPFATYVAAMRDVDHQAAQNPEPQRSPRAAGSGRPIGWPYEVHPADPPSQRVHVIGPHASEWVNVGPSHMEGHCIVAVCRDETGTRYRAVQGPVYTEAPADDVMPTITEGWRPIAYVELWRYAGAVVADNITMAHQRDTPNGPS